MTSEQAKAKARKAASRTGETWFIFYEGDGQWAIGDQQDRETFYCGTNPAWGTDEDYSR